MLAPFFHDQQKQNAMAKKTIDKKEETLAVKQTKDPEHVTEAHNQAENDIAEDADLSIHSPNDDLDEGELANLGGDKNDLV